MQKARNRARGSQLWVLTATIVVATVGCTDESGTCDADDLSGQLFRAFDGATVRIGACRVAGSFTLPAGVTLTGTDRETSVIVGEPGTAAIRVEPGPTQTRVTNLSVESAGPAAIVITGGGRVAVSDVDARVSLGIGLGAEGGGDGSPLELEISDVTLTGPVDAALADRLPVSPENDAATHGLVLVRVAAAELSRVSVQGFADAGALFVDSTTRWQEGGARQNLGTGLFVHAGQAFLQDLVLCDTFGGLRLMPAYGAVFAEGASVATVGCEICRSEGYGMLQSAATAVHTDLRAQANTLAAVWAQFCPSLEIEGSGTVIEDNGLAGIVVYETENTSIMDAQIDATRLAPDLDGETNLIHVGDGLQIVRPRGPLLLRELSLAHNDRIGLLLALDSAYQPVVIEQIAVDGTGDQLGAIAQGVPLGPGWDESVTRSGATATNDPAVDEWLDTVTFRAATNIPDATDVERDGLANLIGE